MKGTSVPIGITTKEPGIPFYPNYVFRDGIAWTIGFAVLCSLAMLLPVHLGAKADPYASAPFGIKPEWYFLALYETLRLFPPQLFNINSEVIVNILVMFTGLAVFLLPFLDRKASEEEYSKIPVIIGVAAIFYISLAISLAYLS
jgi:quinol-cytochrome oxidoreductase complex cytochrome b subunit